MMQPIRVPVARGRLNGLKRYRSPDDPDIAEAAAVLREAVLREKIICAAEADPPLSVEQRMRLAALLLGPGGDAG
jgi:hypothetical protein